MDIQWLTRHEAREASDQQAGAMADTVLKAAVQQRDQAGTLTDDPETELVVVGIEFSASAALNFYLQSANGAGGRKGITHYAGINAGDYVQTWIPMGKGNPIKYTSSAGTLSLRVLYIIRRFGQARATS